MKSIVVAPNQKDPEIMKYWTALAALALFVSAGTARAELILDQTGTEAESMPTEADISEDPNSGGYDDSVDLGQLAATEAGRVRFEYLGNEAGYTNQLYFDGALVFTATTDGWNFNQFSAWFDVEAALLPFALCTSGGLSSLTSGRCVSNDDINSIAAQWFLGGIDGYRSIGFRQEGDDGNRWLIFWDDSGANNDDDYDDLIARIYFEPSRQVPEPATLALFGLGLLGMGMAGRRRT